LKKLEPMKQLSLSFAQLSLSLKQLSPCLTQLSFSLRKLSPGLSQLIPSLKQLSPRLANLYLVHLRTGQSWLSFYVYPLKKSPKRNMQFPKVAQFEYLSSTLQNKA